MKIRNNNEKFGWAGPFEAASFEALADEMMPTIRDWAREEFDAAEADDCLDLNEIILAIRNDFISGLEEI